MAIIAFTNSPTTTAAGLFWVTIYLSWQVYCYPILDYDERADAIFDKLKAIKGRPATKDLRIASIAISHDATLVTGNVGDFEKVPMLKLMPIPV